MNIKDPFFYEKQNIAAVLFDLDGVIVNTAQYHYLAWQRLAEELGFEFPVKANEALKGVSRQESLAILLRYGGVEVGDLEFERLAEEKNQRYVDSLKNLTEKDILPGVLPYIQHIRSRGIRTAIGSASKNACFILTQIGLLDAFDFIADGFCTDKAKPDPAVFRIAAGHLETPPEQCVVFEDSIAGIRAAKTAGMIAVGVGDPAVLAEADFVISGFSELL